MSEVADRTVLKFLPKAEGLLCPESLGNTFAKVVPINIQIQQ
jgi:hypothetical protein